MTVMTATQDDRAGPQDVTVALLSCYPPDARVEIVEGTVYLSRPAGFDKPDLHALPEDGRRHELVDGVIVVSPAPRRIHQRAAARVWRALDDALPQDLEVLVAPFDVDAGPRSQVQPDVLVLPYDDTEDPVPPPPLVVEVLSPSNRRHDLTRKRGVYERAGVTSYWIVDPDVPSVTVLELDAEGHYHEVAHASGAADVHVTRPIALTLCPADLVRVP